MRVVSLASGSGGNACCVEADGGEVLLVDCGISRRELARRAGLAKIDPGRIVAAVFTHDHDDHVKGVETFHSHYPGVALYANMMTAEAIACRTGVGEDDFTLFENGQGFRVGPFEIKAFSIPHDVPDPVGFLVRTERATYFHATDIGAPLDSIGVNLAEADIATLESNHDPVMLAQSRRTECLKRRIRGPRGHLANHEAADLLRRFATPRLKTLLLAHLSQECNAPHLAEAEAKAALAERGLSSVAVKTLSQDGIVEA